MPFFTITVTYGWQISDGGDRDDIAAGEGWDTTDEVCRFEGTREEAEAKKNEMLNKHKGEPCLSASIKEGWK
ncbi:MAG: hypothetical protein KKG04_10550 [Candidatus Thermoplasmatota archaeon]|nr:hypothetical protein [Candidatus Thermoplasmatota archaeon]MBU1864287.1 hypothetical protein [Candidatus Omnitrophota bacterium]